MAKKTKKDYRQRLKEKFGLALEDYDQMLEAQCGVCAICENCETAKNNNGGIKRLSVDHNHETGKVRGLLCARCNMLLGYAKDNPHILVEAAGYLMDKDDKEW